MTTNFYSKNRTYKYDIELLVDEERIEEIVGVEREYETYRTHGKNVIIINASKFIRGTIKDLMNKLERNEKSYIKPTFAFFLLDGEAYGHLIAKNYWKHGVASGKEMSSIHRERATKYYLERNGKIVIISGRIDILDHNKGREKVIEVKTNKSGKWNYPSEAVRQALFYKMCLEQEDKEKYSKYEWEVLLYHVDNQYFEIYKTENEEKVKEDLEERIEMVMEWWSKK